ncbi:MAG TPA: beta-N-acetylhexosaminidase, partial [Balneolaceae bacterium]|nr:beta-N-acetylhexosaminidase [Balneolaceae bacterium]
SFQLTRATTIQIPAHSKKSRYAGNYLLKHLQSSTSYYSISMDTTAAETDSSRIVLSLASDTTGFGNSEGYTLQVTPRKVEIKAPTPHGLFNGVQSLLQLFPAQIMQSDYSLVPQNTKWTAPDVMIRDYPRFSYRGMHLDVGRHFFGVKFVKKYINLMAMYKMDRFHWHLTEDQGWRIQIKKYPKLTEIGAWRDSTIIGHNGSGRYLHKRTGGFYTQKQIREVVNYAKKRFVTIIPEIEMPGHSSAALAAYPKLGCKQNANYHVRSKWGVFKDIYCPSNYTFNFLENVLTEVMKLFPSKYIHIGGDETPKTAWKHSKLAQNVMKREGLKNEKQLQSYFITRIEKFVNKHGRHIIGWDEILEGGLAPGATVMSWHGIKGGLKAAKKHHNAIMTPGNYCYFDHYQGNPKTEPLAIGGFLPLKKVYSYNPVPDSIPKQEAKYILGAQANVWTEYIRTPRKVEYMAYPRALAMAEIDWTPQKERHWNNFWQRLQPQFKRLGVLNVNYAKQYKGKKPHLWKKKKK